jgi:hypothetical protein
MSQRVFQAFLANIAGEADALCFASRATLLRKESFRIGLSAERALLPGEFKILSIS